jgi:DNA mismatch endonuclease (patch repair protein)
MSLIRSSNTSPELALRKALHALGLRYRLHAKDLPGKPDIVFRAQKVALLVHGCFWHRHEGCKVANMPKSNTAFWQGKFDKKVARGRATKEDSAGRSVSQFLGATARLEQFGRQFCVPSSIGRGMS